MAVSELKIETALDALRADKAALAHVLPLLPPEVQRRVRLWVAREWPAEEGAPPYSASGPSSRPPTRPPARGRLSPLSLRAHAARRCSRT